MRLKPVNTEGGGNCALHATCGKWDGKKYIYDDIKALRKQIAVQVRAITVL